jgi:hypothetical protein
MLGQIAQLVEHRTENPGVVSSILTLPSRCKSSRAQELRTCLKPGSAAIFPRPFPYPTENAGGCMVPHRPTSSDLPAVCLHKGSGQGVVRLNGREICCAKAGTPDCEAKCHATIATWLADSRTRPSRAENKPANLAIDVTVNELAEAYLDFPDADTESYTGVGTELAVGY